MDSRTTLRVELQVADGPFSSQADYAAARQRTRHSLLTMALHWGTVLTIVAGVSAMFIRDVAEDSALRQLLLSLHRQAGLLVLIGCIVRLVIRARGQLANHLSNLPAIMQWAAKGTHFVLYVMIAAMPIEGWILSNAHGVSVSLLGLVPLPRLIEDDSELADVLSDYHVWLAWALLAVVLVHALAALWHHFVLKDGVLRAMCPRWLIR
jgi:cytochrome b561